MNEEFVTYNLNDGNIANTLTAQESAQADKKRFLVPHLSVVKGVNDGINQRIDGITYDTGDIGNAKLISRVTQTSAEISVLTRDISVDDVRSVAVVSSDFIDDGADGSRIVFKYSGSKESGNANLILGWRGTENMLSIDCADFVKDGILSNVTYTEDDDDPEITFWWNVDATGGSMVGNDHTTINVRRLLGGLYSGSDFISVDNFKVYLRKDQLLDNIDYPHICSYVKYLDGTDGSGRVGAINEMSGDISTLYMVNCKNLKFLGHIVDYDWLSSSTLQEYFEHRVTDIPEIFNGTYLPCEFPSTLNKSRISSRDETPLVVGNGDVVIIHDHQNNRIVNAADLSVGKNVFVLKAGVSRYEYEKNVDDIATISNWIDQNFGEFPENPENTLARKSLVISSSVSANVVSANTADIVNAGISNLTVTYEIVTDSNISSLSVNYADVGSAGISNLTATDSELQNVGISSLTATNSELSNANISSFTALSGNVVDFTAENETVTNSNISSLAVSSLNVTFQETLGTREENSEVGYCSLVNGDRCAATSAYAHAEGSRTQATGTASHAEGGGTVASNLASHAEGSYTIASGVGAHSEGLGLPLFKNFNIRIMGGTPVPYIGDVPLTSPTQLEIIGYVGIANGPASHSDGICTNTSALGSRVMGTNASDGGNACSFTWNGYDGYVLTQDEIKALTNAENEPNEFIAAYMKAFSMMQGEQYSAKHQGSYCINPIPDMSSELSDDKYSGFYIGDENLAHRLSSIKWELSDYVDKKIFFGNSISGGEPGYGLSLSVLRVSQDEYEIAVAESALISNVIYVVDSNYIDVYGQQIKNLSDATDFSDAVNFNQLLRYADEISGHFDEYYKKTETSSSQQISDEFDNLSDYVDKKIFFGNAISGGEPGYGLSLSVLNVNKDEYERAVATSAVISNVVYIVNSNYIDAYGQQIKNLSGATDVSDAVNLGQVSSLISSNLNNIKEKFQAYDDLSSLSGDSMGFDVMKRAIKFIFNTFGEFDPKL